MALEPAAKMDGFGDALDGDGVCGEAHVDFVVARCGEDGVSGSVRVLSSCIWATAWAKAAANCPALW